VLPFLDVLGEELPAKKGWWGSFYCYSLSPCSRLEGGGDWLNSDPCFGLWQKIYSNRRHVLLVVEVMSLVKVLV
jgi:hypothetical protein